MNDYTHYVNPFIGTGGHGHTHPGAMVPHGMIQPGPDTRIDGWDSCSGYYYEDTTINGFAHTRLSGTGCADFGDFLLMPTVGVQRTDFLGTESQKRPFASAFSHEKEYAEPGYYSVFLDTYGVKAELTSTERAAMHRYTFPESKESGFILDMDYNIQQQINQVMEVEAVNDTVLRGRKRSAYWAYRQDLYFYAVFSKPFTYTLYTDTVQENDKQIPVCKMLLHFETAKDEQVLAKFSISSVDAEGAYKNLQAEMPGWNFDGVRQRARRQWNEALSGVQVEGEEKDKTIFYTSLYHTMIDPRCFSDVDGAYPGADGKVHYADNFIYRTIFSGWDVFRSQFPLQTITNPRLVDDEINSLIQLAELSGKKYFPRWEFLNAYSGCMVGNPAVSVVADAYNKGIRNYDTRKALEYSLNTVRTFGNNEQGYTPDDLSKTLEYAYTDWCVSTMLRDMGREQEAVAFERKAQSYHQVWCDSVKWFRARSADGSWMPWKGRNVHWQGCIESNNYQQGWFVPHDLEGLISLMGKEYFERELVAFFEGADERFMWGDYYNHPNEPDHQVPFMLNYTSRPWLTQYWTRRICRNAYGDTVNGLCGNEDVGQMSAWYILAAMGFHPICPGNNRYELTSPVFRKVILSLDNRYYKGRTFTIIAHHNSPENVYIQSVSLNGKPLNRLWITHEEITKGGVLEFVLGKDPKH